ncbi:MAG: RluA family pseudouridine synthase [Bdellovibrionia bacterium]
MNFKIIEIQITTEPSRIDQALLEALRKQAPEISRNTLKSWFQDQKIYFAGRTVKAALTLAPGEYEIEIRDLAPAALGKAQASASLQTDQIRIAYEDDHLLVLNKDSGTPSVPHNPSETETAVGLALAHYPALANIGRNVLEPGLLHRLDTGTSGLLVFAKSQTEFERLSAAWKKREVEKVYRAWVSPTTPHSPDTTLQLPLRIDTPLAHDAKSARRMVACRESSRTAIRGKPLPAVTHLISLHSKISCSPPLSDIYISDLEIRIETGVMHQIRCHLASLDYPIVGDPIYKGLKSPRLWLHAWRLSLSTSDGKILNLEADLPTNWKSVSFTPPIKS